jgi:Uncharacterized conserved protein (DUF2203)
MDRRTMLHHRHYSAAQANLLLPAVGRVVRRIRDARRRLAVEGFDTDFSTHAELTGGAWPGTEHARAALEVALGFDHLERLDVVVRDLERGLIDFPSLLDGEEVYLCWMLDEPKVGHWHAVESGFGGRRPLD